MPERLFNKLNKTALEELVVKLGHAINANDGRCSLIEDALADATSLCAQALDLVDPPNLRGTHEVPGLLTINNKPFKAVILAADRRNPETNEPITFRLADTETWAGGRGCVAFLPFEKSTPEFWA